MTLTTFDISDRHQKRATMRRLKAIGFILLPLVVAVLIGVTGNALVEYETELKLEARV